MRRRLTEYQANKTAAGSLRREISNDFKYDKKKLKHLFKVLHNINVALGTLGASVNEFSKIKGPTISPDGMLGGLGYVMPIKSIKETLTTSIHSLGEVADSIADELTNPHWNAEDDKETKELIKEKEKVEEETDKAIEEPEIDPNAVETPEEDSKEEEGKEESETEEEAKSEKDETVSPEDVVTSQEFKKASLDKAVIRALLRYSSAGRPQISNKIDVKA